MKQMQSYLLIVATAVLLSACSNEQVKRGTYNALQDYQQHQCDKALEACADRVDYKDYEDKRGELTK